MAGITRDQVVVAVEALTKRGERVSVRAVRAELGTGSLGTVQRYMAEIKPQAQASLSVAVLKALADEVQRVTADKVAELREDLLTADLDKTALAAEVERLTQELSEATAGREAAERELAVSRATLAGLQARLDDAHAMLKRIAPPPAKRSPAKKAQG